MTLKTSLWEPFRAQNKKNNSGKITILYKDLEQDHRYYLHVDPQENVFMGFQNNLNTTLLERDNHRSIILNISNKSEKKKLVNNN